MEEPKPDPWFPTDAALSQPVVLACRGLHYCSRTPAKIPSCSGSRKASLCCLPPCYHPMSDGFVSYSQVLQAPLEVKAEAGVTSMLLPMEHPIQSSKALMGLIVICSHCCGLPSPPGGKKKLCSGWKLLMPFSTVDAIGKQSIARASGCSKADK